MTRHEHITALLTAINADNTTAGRDRVDIEHASRGRYIITRDGRGQTVTTPAETVKILERIELARNWATTRGVI